MRDGDVWTSAGVTAGMDLALALVEEDHGRDVALAIARRLVMYVQRPGGQAQFSTALRAQRRTTRSRCGRCRRGSPSTSPRTCVGAAGRAGGHEPPPLRPGVRRRDGQTRRRASWRSLRVEAARRLLEGTPAASRTSPPRCGFGTPETMRRAFVRTVRVAPSDYRRRFSEEERMTTTGILLFDQVEELDFVGPWEVFTVARRDGRRGGHRGRATRPVRCAKGMRVLPDHTFADCPPLDVVRRAGRPGHPPRGRTTRRCWPGSPTCPRRPRG